MTALVLDTNVLLRMAEPKHPLHQTSVEAVDVLLGPTHQLHIVPQILYEFWVVATRSTKANGLQMTPTEARRSIDGFLASMILLPDNEAVFHRWFELSQRYAVKGTPNHDLRIVAAMSVHRVERLLTFNRRHFAKFREVEVVEPTEVLTWKDDDSSPGKPS